MLIMGRFKGTAGVSNTNLNKTILNKNYPFKNLYGCAEGDMVYVNMESVAELTKTMTTLKDIALIVDISGSMEDYYKDGKRTSVKKPKPHKGFLASLFGFGSREDESEVEYETTQMSSMEKLCSFIVDTLAQFDDDGIDIFFFSNGLVDSANVSSAEDVSNAINHAMSKHNAFHSTMPTPAFKKFTDQIKAKNRSGMVLFLTDGAMDDGGAALQHFYKNVLHNDFKTRDNFYCYAIEFGHSANGALDLLDGLFEPEQGPEDLFDVESADELGKIADVLTQVGGMSAIGSDTKVKVTIESGENIIEMVNADLMDKKVSTIEGPINKIMSFRMVTNKPFVMKIEMQGYDSMRIKVVPRGIDVDIEEV